MASNLDRYKDDLKKLIKKGNSLLWALIYAHQKDSFIEQMEKLYGDKTAQMLKDLPIFTHDYQEWYSEAKALVRQLLPDRQEDFARHYEKPKSRKHVGYENYTIEDCLQGLSLTRGHEKLLGPSAAIPRMQQQLAIVQSAEARFESSLFDIRQLLQADLFDSEIDGASHLLRNNFDRAAGALAGVVLEKHLGEACSNHKLTLKKKDPTIADLNEALKAASVVDTAQWRFVQHLGDIRNLCDHSKKVEPTKEQVQNLLDGVAKVIKTIF